MFSVFLVEYSFKTYILSPYFPVNAAPQVAKESSYSNVGHGNQSFILCNRFIDIGNIDAIFGVCTYTEICLSTISSCILTLWVCSPMYVCVCISICHAVWGNGGCGPNGDKVLLNKGRNLQGEELFFLCSSILLPVDQSPSSISPLTPELVLSGLKSALSGLI